MIAPQSMTWRYFVYATTRMGNEAPFPEASALARRLLSRLQGIKVRDAASKRAAREAVKERREAAMQIDD